MRRALHEDKYVGRNGWIRVPDLHGWIALAISVVILSTCVASADEGSSAGRKRFAPPTVAVVNVRKVLSRCSQWKDSRQEIEQIQTKAESTLGKLQRRIRTLQIDYENLPASTDRAQDKRDELREAMRDYQKTGEKFEEQLSEKRDKALSHILSRINSIVAEYAKDNGIDVVLQSGHVDREEGESPEAIRAILRRTATADVLYANHRYDISEEIAERLNASYTSALSDPPGQ